jgi:hypothetical protein
MQHAAGTGHDQRGGDVLARCVAHNQPQPLVLELEEVVELSSYLSSRLVEVSDLPAL